MNHYEPTPHILDRDALFFFDGKPDRLMLYESLVDKLRDSVPEFTSKTQNASRPEPVSSLRRLGGERF